MRISDWSSDVCSSDLVLSVAAAALSLSSRPDNQRRAASPVKASIRRTPLDTADSPTILKRPMSPVQRRACRRTIRWNNAYPWPYPWRARELHPRIFPRTEPSRPQQWRHQGSSAVSLPLRSEEHTSELQSLMRISYAVFCLKNNTINTRHHNLIRKNPDIK